MVRSPVNRKDMFSRFSDLRAYAEAVGAVSPRPNRSSIELEQRVKKSVPPTT
jgi:hypothetical protein